MLCVNDLYPILFKASKYLENIYNVHVRFWAFHSFVQRTVIVCQIIISSIIKCSVNKMFHSFRL